MELYFVVVLASSIWVFIDAKAIGVKKGQIEGVADLGAWGWFFVCLLLWIIGFPLYLAKRRELKQFNGKLSSACPRSAIPSKPQSQNERKRMQEEARKHPDVVFAAKGPKPAEKNAANSSQTNPITKQAQPLDDFKRSASLVLLFLVIGCGEVFGFHHSGGWGLINISLALVFSYPIIILHELGHALAIKSVGFRLVQLNFGGGPRLVTFKTHGCMFDFRAYPLHGLAEYHFTQNSENLRGRELVAILGGPLSEVALLVISGIWMSIHWPLINCFSSFQPVLVLTAINCIGLIENLIPHSYILTDGRKVESDGAQMIKLLRGLESR